MLLITSPVIVQSPLELLCEAINEELVLAEQQGWITKAEVNEITERCYNIRY